VEDERRFLSHEKYDIEKVVFSGPTCVLSVVVLLVLLDSSDNGLESDPDGRTLPIIVWSIGV
jgi:hypothetical protein